MEIGVRFTAEHFMENYGLKESEFSVEDAAPVAPEEGGLPYADFAAPGGKRHPAEKAQAALDKAIVNMLPRALKASNEFVTEVENAIHAAKSYEDLQDALVELLAPSLTPGALEAFLASAMTAASGHGAAAVATEEATDGDSIDAAAVRAEVDGNAD